MTHFEDTTSKQLTGSPLLHRAGNQAGHRDSLHPKLPRRPVLAPRIERLLAIIAEVERQSR
jgi:hypothetical protein